MADLKKKLKKSGQLLRQELRERTIGYILAGFGITAGLAWNEAIKSLIEYIFPLSANTIITKFIYAILMTFIVVVMAVYLVRIFKEEDGKEEKKK